MLRRPSEGHGRLPPPKSPPDQVLTVHTASVTAVLTAAATLVMALLALAAGLWTLLTTLLNGCARFRASFYSDRPSIGLAWRVFSLM